MRNIRSSSSKIRIRAARCRSANPKRIATSAWIRCRISVIPVRVVILRIARTIQRCGRSKNARCCRCRRAWNSSRREVQNCAKSRPFAVCRNRTVIIRRARRQTRQVFGKTNGRASSAKRRAAAGGRSGAKRIVASARIGEAIPEITRRRCSSRVRRSIQIRGIVVDGRRSIGRDERHSRGRETHDGAERSADRVLRNCAIIINS